MTVSNVSSRYSIYTPYSIPLYSWIGDAFYAVWDLHTGWGGGFSLLNKVSDGAA